MRFIVSTSNNDYQEPPSAKSLHPKDSMSRQSRRQSHLYASYVKPSLTTRSRAQFISQMKKWKFRQKMTEQAWKYVGHHIRKRQAINKESEVRLSGILLDKDKVLYEIHRYDLPTLMPNRKLSYATSREVALLTCYQIQARNSKRTCRLLFERQPQVTTCLTGLHRCHGSSSQCSSNKVRQSTPTVRVRCTNIIIIAFEFRQGIESSASFWPLSHNFSPLAQELQPLAQELQNPDSSSGTGTSLHRAKAYGPNSSIDQGTDRCTVAAPTMTEGDLQELIRRIIFQCSNNLDDKRSYLAPWMLLKGVVTLLGPSRLPVLPRSGDHSTAAFLEKILTKALAEDLQPLFLTFNEVQDWRVKWARAPRHLHRSAHLAIIRWVLESGHPPDPPVRIPLRHISHFPSSRELVATPLQLAIATRSHDVAELLLEHHASICLTPEAFGKFRELRDSSLAASPLEMALSALPLWFTQKGSWCSLRSPDTTINLLLKHGAGRDHSRQTHELYSAVRAGNESAVQSLLQRGASLKSKLFSGTDIGFADWPVSTGTQWHLHTAGNCVDHLTVFTAAASSDAYETLDPDPIMGCLERVSPPASQEAALKLLKLLYSYERRDYKLVSGNDTWNPVDIALIAAGRGHDQVIEWLISLGANISYDNSCGISPLLAAAGKGQRSTCRLLYDKGRLEAAQGCLALHVAIFCGKPEIVKDLLSSQVSLQLCADPRQLLNVLQKLQVVQDHNLNELRKILGSSPLSVAVHLGLRSPWPFLVRRRSLAQCATMLMNAGAPLAGSELALAAATGDLRLLQLALASGAEINRRHTDSKETSLQIAVRRGQVDATRALLHAGAGFQGDELGLAIDEANVPENNLSFDQGSPCRLEMVELLLQHGVDWQQHTAKGEGNFELALRTRDLDLIKFMAQHFLIVYDPGALCAAVQYAIAEGDASYVESLLRIRPKDQSVGILEGTAVAMATCLDEAHSTLAKLLRFIPPSDECLLPFDSITRDVWNMSKNRNKLLATAFWRLPPSDSVAIASPLAVSTALNKKSVWTLLQHGYRPDELALALAVKNQNRELTVAFLTARPLMPTNWDNWKQLSPSPLALAARNNDLEMLRVLLDKGYAVDHRSDPDDPTVLQEAMRAKSWEVASFLLQHGADVNAKPALAYGATALQYAALHGNLNFAQQLLQLVVPAKLDAHRARFEGRTALEGAAEHGRLDMVALLLSYGAKTEGSGQRQYLRAIRWAERNMHTAVAKLLREHREWTAGDEDRWTSDTHLMDEIWVPRCVCGDMLCNPYLVHKMSVGDSRNGASRRHGSNYQDLYDYAVSECSDSDCGDFHFPSYWKFTRSIAEDGSDLGSETNAAGVENLEGLPFPSCLDSGIEKDFLPAWLFDVSDLDFATHGDNTNSLGGFVYPLDLDLGDYQIELPANNPESCDSNETDDPFMGFEELS